MSRVALDEPLMTDPASGVNVFELLRPILEPVAEEHPSHAAARAWVLAMRCEHRLSWDHPHDGGVIRFTFTAHGTYIALLLPWSDGRRGRASEYDVRLSIVWSTDELAEVITTRFASQGVLL